MADFRGVSGALSALRLKLEQGLPALSDAGMIAEVSVLDSTSLDDDGLASLTANTLGIYLHRIEVDPTASNRSMPPPRANLPRQPELIVNLHLLLIALRADQSGEAMMMGWAMQLLAAAAVLDHALLSAAEPEAQWHPDEALQVFPEAMATQDLLRIWEGLPADYHLSAPYVIRNLRVLPSRLVERGPIVGELEFGMGRHP